MTKPTCYFASHLGFSETTEPWYEALIDESKEFVTPINPFQIAGERFIPTIMDEQDLTVRKRLWGNMAVELYRRIKDEADMVVAVLDGEPPDAGMACEVGYTYALNDVGYKQIPTIVYRNDLRSGGDGELGFNAMFLPPFVETGGAEVRGTRADLVAQIGKTAATVRTN